MMKKSSSSPSGMPATDVSILHTATITPNEIAESPSVDEHPLEKRSSILLEPETRIAGGVQIPFQDFDAFSIKIIMESILNHDKIKDDSKKWWYAAVITRAIHLKVKSQLRFSAFYKIDKIHEAINNIINSVVDENTQTDRFVERAIIVDTISSSALLPIACQTPSFFSGRGLRPGNEDRAIVIPFFGHLFDLKVCRCIIND